MRTVFKLFKWEAYNTFRNRFIVGYFAFFLILTSALAYFSSDISKVIITLLNLILLFVPLVSLVFSSLIFYTSREFTELVLVQPIDRNTVYISKVAGISVPLSLAVGLGIGLPLAAFRAPLIHTLLLTLSSIYLTLIFSTVAIALSALSDDRVKGLALGLAIWIYAGVLYDAIILFIGTAFSDYPIEKLVILLSILNPVDLARILIVMNLDIAALMGYTGALFVKYVSSVKGYAVILASLTLWFLVPLMAGMYIFRRKNF